MTYRDFNVDGFCDFEISLSPVSLVGDGETTVGTAD